MSPRRSDKSYEELSFLLSGCPTYFVFQARSSLQGFLWGWATYLACSAVSRAVALLWLWNWGGECQCCLSHSFPLPLIWVARLQIWCCGDKQQQWRSPPGFQSCMNGAPLAAALMRPAGCHLRTVEQPWLSSSLKHDLFSASLVKLISVIQVGFKLWKERNSETMEQSWHSFNPLWDPTEDQGIAQSSWQVKR